MAATKTNTLDTKSVDELAERLAALENYHGRPLPPRPCYSKHALAADCSPEYIAASGYDLIPCCNCQREVLGHLEEVKRRLAAPPEYGQQYHVSVTVRVGTTLSARCEPDRSRWISAKWPPLGWLGSRMDGP